MALFGLVPKKSTPKPQPVVPMPDPNGPEADAARRRELLRAQSRSGRASTMLGSDYSSSTLGSP